MKSRIKKVVAKARRRSPGKQPAIKAMARELVREDRNLAEGHGNKLGFKFITVRQILDGTYPASKRLGIDRL